MSIEEEIFELNYIKIDSENEVRILNNDEIVMETNSFLTAFLDFEEEKVGKNLLNYLKNIIQEGPDLLKINIEYSKQFIKSIKSDKKNLHSSINRILSTDFKGKFIFNQTNVEDVYRILIIVFGDFKKNKISTFTAFTNAIKNIKFEKYNFFEIYSNNEYLKNKENEKMDNSSSILSSQWKSTVNSSISAQIKDKDYEETSELEENYLLSGLNRLYNEKKGLFYIDNNIRNIRCSSIINEDNYNYNEEDLIKKILTKECFSYPKCNKGCKILQNELPLELILLLYKLKKVETLIFQIQNLDVDFLKMAIFILININWLFINGIKEIKFDLGNDSLQNGINDVFRKRATDLYHNFKKSRNLIYNNNSLQARTINLWEPETDMFFEKFEREEKININKKKIEYLYNIQPNERVSTFDNHLCNIYNEFGNLTNLKYIRPISYTIRNKINEIQKELKEEFDESYSSNNEFLNLSISEIQKMERESISLNYSNITNQKNNSNITQNSNNNEIPSDTNNESNSNKKKTSKMLLEFIEKNKQYFEMIAIYSHFLSKNSNLKKLCFYFHTPYAYELCLLFKMKFKFEQSHFLIFANKIEKLTDLEFSFNSLDSQSFGYILGIINKNSDLTSLKMSFFTPDINYYNESLFNLVYSQKLSLTKLFKEQKDFEIKFHEDKEKKIINYILNQKLLEQFIINLRNFFNSIKLKLINKLETFILRFDIPIPLLDNDKYINSIIKFIINLFIIITFQENHIYTFKILAPHLELNCSNRPYIRKLFKEISLKNELFEDEEWEEKIKIEKQKKEKIRIKEKEREKKELRDKENQLKEQKKELKEKKERKELLEKINSEEEINQYENNNIEEIDNNYQIDVDNNIANFDFSKRFRSVAQRKNKLDKSSRKKEPIIDDDLPTMKRSELNQNFSLEYFTLQLKIYDLPEIFNFCLINNLNGLKYINLGSFDEETFIGFMNSYREYYNKLKSLKILKISLGLSVISYNNLEEYILEYININPPVLEEKYLFSNLQIINKEKMKELAELVYLKVIIDKLVVQISNRNAFTLAQVSDKILSEYQEKIKSEIYSVLLIAEKHEFQKLRTPNILHCLSSFYKRNNRRVIICKEDPNCTSI